MAPTSIDLPTNQALVHRFFTDVVNRRRLEVLDEIGSWACSAIEFADGRGQALQG
jgi:hypothetical protein